jgi:hypothetical protein
MYRVFFPDGSWLVEENWGMDQTPDGGRAKRFYTSSEAIAAVNAYRGSTSSFGYGIDTEG